MGRTSRQRRDSRLVFDTARLLGALLAAGTSRAAAQADSLHPLLTEPMILTVQPREAATGRRNPAAGRHLLASDTNMIVTVPPQCVGAKRCPLFLFLPGGRQTAAVVTRWLGPVANRHGLILLALTKYSPAVVDTALKMTLRQFAIDPDKIAVIGRCFSGGTGMNYGVNNLHVFSRVAVISGPPYSKNLEPKTTNTEFLFDDGFLEVGGFEKVHELEKQGYVVRYTATLRGHEHQAEDYDFLGRWLRESWTKPPARRTPPAVLDPLPLLTTEAVARMTSFWTSFFRLPKSIWGRGRWPYIRDVVAPVGQERLIIPMTDMAALAAKYPPVAVALKNAGFTGRQHDAYRLALATAMIAAQAGAGTNAAIEPNSALAKNVAFFKAHPDDLEALASAGVKNQDEISLTSNLCCTRPEQMDRMAPLGIWRTP